MTPLQAAAGVGYGEGFAANHHRFAPTGMLAAVKYLVEDLHAAVRAVGHEQPSLGIEGQGVGRVKLARGRPLLSPGLDELSIT